MESELEGGTGFTPAPELVPEIVEELDDWVSDEMEQNAVECAEWITFEESGVSHAPSSLAAASVYRAGILVNEKRTQAEVAEAADIAEGTLQSAFSTLKDRDSVNWKRHATGRGQVESRGGGALKHLRDKFRL